MSKFCENCGSELKDTDKQCPNCGAAVVETTTKKDVKENPTNTTNTEKVNTNGEKNKKTYALIGGIAAAVVIVLILIIALMSSANSYKKPLDNLFAGIQKANSKTFLKAFPEVMRDDMEDSFDNDDLEELLESFEDEVGKNVKISYKVLDKEKIDKDDLEDLQDSLEDEYGSKKTKITKGYKLTIKITIKGKDDSDTSPSMDINVYKIGGKWCLGGMSSLSSLF